MSTDLPDLAVRANGGNVVAANDEFFADRDNLINEGVPVFTPHTFNAKGQVYDGWETRRRRGEPGDDWAIVRLGIAGVPRLVVVDTANFTGNYPPACTVHATSADGYPSPHELRDWAEIVPRSDLRGDTRHEFAVDPAAARRCTHVRLTIHPDGGVARLRVHGEPLPDPRELAIMPFDLAATANGGRAVACSDSFFSRPANMLQPGASRFMGDGWETARRRDDGDDWAVIELTGPGLPRVVEVATTHYKGNSPDAVTIRGLDARAASIDDDDAWFPLVDRQRLQPDTTHRFAVAGSRPVTHVRLDIHPDGGVGRLRVFGDLTDDGLRDLTRRWFDAMPDAARAAAAADPLVTRVLTPDSTPR